MTFLRLIIAVFALLFIAPPVSAAADPCIGEGAGSAACTDAQMTAWVVINSDSLDRLDQSDWRNDCLARGGVLTYEDDGDHVQDCVNPADWTEENLVSMSRAVAQRWYQCLSGNETDTGWYVDPTNCKAPSGAERQCRVLSFSQCSPSQNVIKFYAKKTRKLSCPNGFAAVSTAEGTKCQQVVCDRDCDSGVQMPSLANIERQPYFGSASGSLLQLEGVWNSQGVFDPQDGAPNTAITAPSRGWTHNFDKQLYPGTGMTGVMAVIHGADGKPRYFGTDGTPIQAFSGGPERLEPVSTGWKLHTADHRIEEYDLTGRLVAISTRGAERVDIGYDQNGLLESVVDQTGRSLVFTRNPNGQISTVGLPDGTSIGFTYTGRGALHRVVWPDGTFREYRYDDSNTDYDLRLEQVIDENSERFVTYDYSSKGMIRDVTYGPVSMGLAGYAYTYNSKYHIGYVVGPTGQSITRTFGLVQGVKKLIKEVETCSGCASRTTTITYDGNGWPNLITDPAGSKTLLTHTADGLETERIEGAVTSGTTVLSFLRKVQTNWDVALSVPTERRTYDASGALVQKRTMAYNSRGQISTASEMDPITQAARTTTFSYCEAADVAAPNSTCPVLGQLKSIDGPRTDVPDNTTYSYYPTDDLTGCATAGPCHRRGDLHEVTAPGNLTTRYERYDLAGRPTRVLDANGGATDLEYNLRGWLTARKIRGMDPGTEVDDAVIRIEYDSVGQVTKIIQPDGAFLAFTYDAAHRLTGIADNSGSTVNYTLDGTGNRIAEETRDAGNVLRHNLSRVYDQLGQLVTLADALSTPTDLTYDVVGNVDGVTDAYGRTTDTDYDPLGRLKLSIANVGGAGPVRAETRFEYDALDRVTAVVDPKGLTTTYNYNDLGDLVELDSPDTGTTTYTYDSAGNRTGQLDARGVQTNYSYDALNRLTRIDLPTAGQDIDFAYDAVPAICQANETFAAGRLSGYTDASGSTSYCHDRRGNVVRKVQSVAGAPDATVAYAYNPADRVMAVTYPSGATVSYLRDAGGRITGVLAKPTASAAQVAVVSDVDYLPFGPATQFTFGNGRVLAKAFDQNYGIAGITDSAVDGMDLDYTLDAVGNVTGLAERMTGGSTATRAIDYDGLDRLTALKDGASTVQAFTYDATGNRASKTAGITEAYTYPTDSHRLTDVGGVSRGYDAAGNTTTMGASRAFLYDDRGRLAQLTDAGVPTREYAYNARGERVAKRNPTVSGGDITYVYDESGHLLGEYDVSGLRIKEYVWLDDTLVAVLGDHGGSDHQYVLTDHLGTPRAVVHPGSNALLWRWDLTASAFGDHLAQPDPDDDGVSYTFNLRYPGQYFDAESGMHYNYFRDYDPSTGRYVQSDPIGLLAGVSTFSYVSGSPLRFVDVLGLEKVPLFGPAHPDQVTEAIFIARVGEYRDTPGVWSVYAHGWMKNVFDMRGEKPDTLTIEALAKILEGHGWKPGDPVVLYACRTGKGENSFAEQFARKYGSDVTAPNRQVWYNQNIGQPGPTWINGKNVDGTRNESDVGRMITFPGVKR